MGIRQEHDRVLKLQVVQAIHGMIPYHERAQHGASFESAHRHVLGTVWDEAGLSLESAEGMGHYLRGIHSAKGTPVTLHQGRLMRSLARRASSLEMQQEAVQGESLAAAIHLASFESQAELVFTRYGLKGLSLEAGEPSAWKNLVSMIAGLFKSKDKSKKEDDEPFDPANVDYSSVHKMAAYIDQTFLNNKDEWEPVEGNVSAEGIVQNLSWGKDFDEKSPVEFTKRKFAEWDKFYHQHEAAVEKMSKLIEHDEQVTRAAVAKVKDDQEAMDKILEDASKTLLAADNPTKLCERLKPVFPGALEYATYKRSSIEFQSIHTAVAKGWKKDLKQIRPLTKEEAVALLTWLRDAVSNLKKYTTIFNKGKWSDHSDGDDFWDYVEQCSWTDEYAGLIYWQSCDQDFVDSIPDISEILSKLSNGIIAWVSRSFK